MRWIAALRDDISDKKKSFTSYLIMNWSFQHLSELYRKTLLEDVIPFWAKNSPDREHGGYFTCLDREGNVYDTDKFVWLQARQVWTFSMLYNRVAPKEEWLEIARGGADFLRDHVLDEKGDVYFSLDRKGTPLIQAYNIFSDCFTALGFHAYAKGSGDAKYEDLASARFQRILQRQHNPKGIYEKSTGNRPLKGFALPMIIANLLLEMEGILPYEEESAIVDQCIYEVMQVFFDPRTGLIHEHVTPEGAFLDTFDGRLINPGHGIEAMWFLMDIAHKRGDEQLLQQTVNRTLHLLQFGWDEQYGGIFYFLDAKSAPPLQLEWDQKLWWVHLETLVALAKAYLYTRRQDVWEAYQTVHTYTWDHFPDSEYGEWYGYLNRQGEILLPLKGGKWKGCYHVPRALLECWKCFERLAEENK